MVLNMNKMKNTNSDEVENKIRKSADDLIYLLSCAFNEEVPDIDRCKAMDLQNVYQLASLHFLAAAAAYALEQVMELTHEFDQAKKKAIRKLSLFEIERSAVLNEFEKARIWYLPLKGIVLGKYYPKTAMREMSDNDILIDDYRCGDVKAIMERLGFICDSFMEFNHDVYSKPPTVEFEIHRSLFDKGDISVLYSYYSDIKDRLNRKHDYEYTMSDEDFYIYLIAHTYKHYRSSGTGLRSLADIYIFLKTNGNKLNTEYIDAELSKLRLNDFEKKIKSLSNKIFTNAFLDEADEEMLCFFVFSSVYGDAEKLEYNNKAKVLEYDDSKKSKKEYFKNRFFIKGEVLAKNYPFVYKHKILYPSLLVFRLLKGLICHPKELRKEYKDIKDFKLNEKI